MVKYFESHNVAPVLFEPHSSDIRPYLNVNLLDLTICGLLDSGAAVSIIGNGAHTRLINAGYPVESSTDSKVTVADGSECDTIGFMTLPITFNDVTKIIRFHVIPSIVSNIILGVDFWKAFNLMPEIFKSIAYVNSPPDFLVNSSNLSGPVTSVQSFQDLSLLQKELADSMIESFKDISFERKGLGRTSLIQHTIDTGGSPPIKCRPYPMSPEKLGQLHKELDRMLELDVVTKSESPWNNPVLMVPKSDGSWRFCLDCRKLNAITKGDAYSIPYIPQILDSLKNAKFISSVDFKASFWQIPLEEAAQEKTSFTVPGRGLFKFKVMPFGLCGAPARQQRLMDMLFGHPFCSDVTKGMIFCYVDDIIVVSEDYETHLLLLNRLHDRIKSTSLTINFEKSKFFRRTLKYLGYVVDECGLRTDPDKVSAILNFPVPSNPKEVKMFLGTCSWYRRFIRNFSTIAAPLNALTSTKVKFNWSSEADSAFNDLKNALVSAPVLACPDFDQPFTVHCDASSYGIGGMLTQVQNGEEHPIAYISRSLNKNERNYSATEREALAVIYAVEKFEPYLGTREFTVITDHASLQWFLRLENPTGRLARWGCRLSQYNFKVVHRKGKDNVVPDALSRFLAVEAIVGDSGDDWYDRIFKSCQSNPLNFPNYRVENGTLYRFSKSKYNLTQEFDWKVVVPKAQRAKVIADHHEPPAFGHFGVFKTHRKLSLQFYWPGMYRDVVEFVRNCGTCAAYKHSTRLTPGLMGQPKQCYRPFQVLSVDLVGPLPKSRSGFVHLLVVTCCFSKYTMLFPLRRATSALVAKAFEHFVLLAHGVPETVITDNGVQFTGSEFRGLLERYNVPRVHYGPRYTPQVNLVERYNKTVMTAVSSYVKDDHRTWDVNLYKIQFALNSAVNECTGFSPFFLVHGREPIINGSFYIKSQKGDYEVTMPREEYAGEFGILKEVFEKVRERILKAHQTNAKYYNTRRRPMTLKVGQEVWKQTFVQSDAAKYKASKLAPKFEKCIVAKILSPLVYELVSLDGKPLGAWHISKLKVRY